MESLGLMETVPEVLKLAEKVAAERYGGHLTIMRFTTGWKAAFQTPNLDTGEGREDVWKLKSFSTLEEALNDAIVHNTVL